MPAVPATSTKAVASNAASDAVPREAGRRRPSAHDPSVTAASHTSVSTIARPASCAMKVGARSHSGHRGDSHSNSVDEPSRPLFTSKPSWATSSTTHTATPSHTSRCCAARRAGAVAAEPICTAIGSISSSMPDVTGRPGAADPPHQMRNAPTVPASASTTSATSSARRRSAPGRRAIVHRPKPAST